MHTRSTRLLLLLALISSEAFSQTFTDGPSAAINADGRIEIFARGTDGAVWHNWQGSPGGSWVGWYSLGGWISGSPVATVNADGRLDVFVLGSGNTAYHNYQTSPGGGWSGWISIGGGIATPPTVVTNSDGRLEIFAEGTDCAVWHAWQTIPGGDFTGWTSLGGCISDVRSPSAVQNADGRLEIFILGGGPVYHNWQGSPGGGWNGWASLGGSLASTPTAAINDDGRLEIFAQGTDNAGWHAWQTSPGGTWTDWSSLGGGISGPPSVELDTTYLDVFALGAGSQPFVIYESNWAGGWNPLGGIINAAPATAVNFDGRLEIFGIGTDGNVYHDWQEAPGGTWSRWQPLSTPSNSGTTNGGDMTYFVSDADDEAYYANMKGQTCPTNMPNLWRGPLNGMTYAWPCGGVANTSFVEFGDTTSPVKAMQHWNAKISDWYAPYFNGQNTPNPAFLALESGGPQSIVTKRVCDTCIPGDDPGNYGRGINKNQTRDASNRLATVEIDIINGVKDGTALKQLFAHELGHTFGLVDCSVSAHDTNNNPLYDCTKTVMASTPIVPGHGWDSVTQNATTGFQPSSQPPGYANQFELLSGPTSCDMQIIDQNLPDYRQCPVPVSNNSVVPTCTNGTAEGFMDTGGGTGTYTCGGQACDGCNPNCNNFAPQKCGGGGSSSCPDTASCDDFSPGVFATDYCMYPSGGCPYDYYSSNYCCYNGTPIVVDAFKEGFHLTSLTNGVTFRVHPNQSLYQVSWTDPQWHNGWLVLDRNGNGTIDDFTELFGNFTPQPSSSTPNGYVALAVFDDPMNGGNGNGVIDPGDSVYDNLRVWIDANHNGVSEPNELHTLRELGVFRIGLRYTLSHYVDPNGNHFRYRAQIWDGAGGAHNACYDVVVQFSLLKGKN